MKPATLSSIARNNAGQYISTRIRASRNTGTTAIVGYVPPKDETIMGYVADADTNAVNGYVWREIRVKNDTGDTVTGYVANDYVEVTLLPDLPTFHDFVLGKITITWTTEDKDEFAALLDAGADRSDEHAANMRLIAKGIREIEGRP